MLIGDANTIQISGEHYKSGFQHWDWVVTNNMDYFRANATKYITRHKKKNGLADLRKALHYLVKLQELVVWGIKPTMLFESTKFKPKKPVSVEVFCQYNDLDSSQRGIMEAILESEESEITSLTVARILLDTYIEEFYGASHDIL